MLIQLQEKIKFKSRVAMKHDRRCVFLMSKVQSHTLTQPQIKPDL